MRIGDGRASRTFKPSIQSSRSVTVEGMQDKFDLTDVIEAIGSQIEHPDNLEIIKECAEGIIEADSLLSYNAPMEQWKELRDTCVRHLEEDNQMRFDKELDYKGRIEQEYGMEPDTKYGELMNEGKTVGLCQDDTDMPVDIDSLGKAPDEVEQEQHGKEDVYKVTVGDSVTYISKRLAEPTCEVLDKEFSEVFLFNGWNASLARAPIPGDEQWNVLIAPRLVK